MGGPSREGPRFFPDFIKPWLKGGHGFFVECEVKFLIGFLLEILRVI